MGGINPVFVEVVRGPIIESRHRASIAVANSSGQIVNSWGDINQLILPRSAMKPLLAIGMVESGALDAFGLTDLELALHCSSHNGEHIHRNRIRAWLKTIGCRESDLECTPQRPLGEQWLHLEPHECPPPGKATNNCSGKHTGFITTARHLAVPIENYTSPDHPVQSYSRKIISDLTGQSIESMPLGCDDCGAPAYGLPVFTLAKAAARMAMPSDSSLLHADSMRRVVAAMCAHPHLVAGTGRVDTLIMKDRGF